MDLLFKVGDKVTAFGLEGIILEVSPKLASRAYTVSFIDFYGNEYVDSFTIEGKYFHWHKDSVLKKINENLVVLEIVK
jgi:hypothetical protein